MADGGTRHQFANYDKRLISILEVVGSHFVDIYFNHVYNSSQTKLKAGGSLTDEYTRQIRAYITGVKTDEQLYRTVIQGLHRYFQNATRFSALSFTDFVERIVSQFIPPEYYGQFKTQEKDETLGSIVADLVSGLGVYISSSDMLRRVIDEHNLNTNVTIRMLQDQAITILLNKRGEVHNSFLRRIGQAKDTVSMEIVDQLKAAIRKLVGDKAKLKAQLGEAEERAMELEDAVKSHKKRETKYKKLIAMMQAEREQGLRGAAVAAAVPRRSTIAEVDPLDFSQRRPEVPRQERIAERAAQGAARAAQSAARVAEPSHIAETPAKAAKAASFFDSPSTSWAPAAKGPAKGAPVRVPSGRTASLTDFMAAAGADESAGTDEADAADDAEPETGSE